MPNNWVDFKTIKAAVSMEMILSRYQINWLRKSGDELRGRCPIHQGEGQSTFHVNVAKNAFHCFSCKARGNVLDFVAAMEQCSVRDAAVKLRDWFVVTSEPATAPAKTKPAKAKPAEVDTVEERGVVNNKPLGFQLKGVDPSHPYLAERGISKETAQAFGIGFFSGRGSMSGRVVIPIHNERGELVAYAGRSVGGSEPKYKLPAGFHKSLELFNLHRIIAAREVIVVEGFFDCMKVWQVGRPNVVALMGSALSEAQEALLARFRYITLFLDGDEIGRAASSEMAARLVRSHWVRVVALKETEQPDMLSSEAINELLERG